MAATGPRTGISYLESLARRMLGILRRLYCLDVRNKCLTSQTVWFSTDLFLAQRSTANLNGETDLSESRRLDAGIQFLPRSAGQLTTRMSLRLATRYTAGVPSPHSAKTMVTIVGKSRESGSTTCFHSGTRIGRRSADVPHDTKGPNRKYPRLLTYQYLRLEMRGRGRKDGSKGNQCTFTSYQPHTTIVLTSWPKPCPYQRRCLLRMISRKNRGNAQCSRAVCPKNVIDTPATPSPSSPTSVISSDPYKISYLIHYSVVLRIPSRIDQYNCRHSDQVQLT